MSRRAFAAVLAVVVLAAACGKQPAPTGPTAARLPKGDVIWLADAAAASDPTLEAELEKVGAVAVFVPGGTLGAAYEAAAEPARPLARLPVVLVLRPDDSLLAALTTSDGPDAQAVSATAGAALSRAISSGAYGRVAGLHLDFPYAPRAAPRYAALVGALKRGLPAGTFVSITLMALPAGEEDRKKAAPLYEAADALVAFVFGPESRTDPVATDALRRPWWAAYDTRAVGEVFGRAGEARASVPGRVVEPLSGNGRFEFENDLSVNDASVSAFTFTARAPVKVEGLDLAAGDRIAFRLPAISELLFQLGSNLAGKRHALGRALLFEGATEAERVFDIAALEDVLLGRPLIPALTATVKPAGRNALAVELVNGSHHASVVSRVDNWIEVDVAPSHPAEVQLGGFDRYEVYDRSGRPVTPGRATSVRLYETLIGPLESVTPARIVVRGTLPAACCRYRLHAVSAAGPEVVTDWTSPPPPPTPEPKAPVKPKRK